MPHAEPLWRSNLFDISFPPPTNKRGHASSYEIVSFLLDPTSLFLLNHHTIPAESSHSRSSDETETSYGIRVESTQHLF